MKGLDKMYVVNFKSSSVLEKIAPLFLVNYTYMPWILLWTLMVHSFVMTSLMVDLCFSPFPFPVPLRLAIVLETK